MSQNSEAKNCKCVGRLQSDSISETIPLAGRRVRVEGISGYRCDQCGEVFLNGAAMLKLEEKLLKQRQPVTT